MRRSRPSDTAQARPAARRLRQPSWRDARLVVGVLLVLASVVLGARVVAAAKETTHALVATRDLSPGEAVSPSDLRDVEVRLGDLTGAYVAPGAVVRTGLHVVQAVRAGELVPTDSLGTREQVGQRQVALPAPSGSVGALVRGTAVEVWVSKRSAVGGADVYAAPRKVVGGATIARDPQEGASLMGGGSTVTLQVWVPAAVVPELLAAVDARDRITAVPLPGAALRVDS